MPKPPDDPTSVFGPGVDSQNVVPTRDRLPYLAPRDEGRNGQWSVAHA